MSDVSTQTLTLFRHALLRRGVDEDKLYEGLDTSREQLALSKLMTWQTYAAMTRRLEHLLGGPESLPAVGSQMLASEAFLRFASVFGWVTHPRYVYWVATNYLSKPLFQPVNVERYEEIAPNHLRIGLVIQDRFEDCPQFFRITQGALTQHPTLIGYPPARVEMQLGPRRAVYDVYIQQPPGLASWWRRLTSSLFGTSGARQLRELTEVQAAVNEGTEVLYKAHIELTEHRARLEERVHELEKLRDLEARLVHGRRLESLAALTNGVASTFRDGLADLLSETDKALAAAPRSGPEVEALRLIESRANELLDLTEQLLAYQGSAPLRTGLVDLQDLARAEVQLARIEHGDRVTVTSDTARLSRIVGDASQLRQAVANLLLNALESSDTARVSLDWGQVTVHEPTIDALGKSIPPGDYVEILIRDDGPGIPADALEHVFDPFYSTRDDRRGLGLPAVVGITHGHGGHLELHTNPEGTTLRLRFPVPGPGDEWVTPEAPPSRGGWILLVDDDLALLHTTAELLEVRGYSVYRARDAHEALQVLTEAPERFVGMITDWRMPGLDGIGLFRASRTVAPTLPVILYTGEAGVPEAQSLLDEGLCGVVKKPAGSRALLDLLDL